MPDTPANRSKLHFSFDLRLVVGLLLVIIAVMLLVWKPWSGGPATDRTIKVTGEATLKSEPDEFIFYPTYQFKNANPDAALAEMTQKSEELIAGLKHLGVADKQIKSNASGSEEGLYYPLRGDDTTYNLQLTVTANSRQQAQKVQDYLLTTSPTGSVTPSATFSESKRKSLENQARSKATQDARAKAEQSAEDLDARLGKVKSVTDGAGFGGIIPLAADSKARGAEAVMPTQLTVQPGENELTYTVTAEFYLK